MRFLLTLFTEIPNEVIQQITTFIEDGESVSLIMALVDLLPNIAFMAGMGFIIKAAFGKIRPIFFALLSGGSLLAFLAGTIKASWKVLCALGYNCIPLTASFGLYQFIGMTMIAVGAVSLTISDKKTLKPKNNNVVLSANVLIPLLILGLASVTAKMSAMWVILLVLPTAVYQISFALMAFRRKMIWQGILFLASLVLATLMGVLKKQFEVGGDFAKLNWLAQCVNIVAQVLLLVPAYLLCKVSPKMKMVYEEA